MIYQKDKGNQKGFVIALMDEEQNKILSFFDMNGIGDWSLAGDFLSAEIFDSIERAQKCIEENHLGQFKNCIILKIDRTFEAIISEV